MQVVIIYDSVTGNTKKMAEAVAEGVRMVEGVNVCIKHVDEAQPEDLLSEGVIIGSPAYCGLMTWKLKAFFDNSVKKAWGKVDGHIATAFSSSAALGGGNEMTLWSILNSLMNYGFMVFGITKYAGRGVTAHYGAAAVGNPRELDLKACRMLGRRAAEYVLRNFGQAGKGDNQ